ncbi:MAG: CxxC-x17-CxxC domain-containing protein [Candidatus Paceibacterota bacterium]
MCAVEIPTNKDITYIGQTTFRDKNQLFGIKRKDRRQHVYILGKSGTGKSVLMSNMVVQNIQNGDGVCVVDPHGELVEEILQSIPPHRMKDVIYFNPADTDYHIGFNVLELIDPKYKHLVASGLMGIFTKIWANAWSARMEYILNNAILALLDTPGTTLLGIPRMLVDKDYRQKIISNLKDPVIKAFWIHEYEQWQEKFRNEAIAPIQNKVGQFLSTSIIRNVVGQSISTINVFDIMNQGKIFLVNVSKGRIGEDNSALLGGMIITKIQLAAMERVRIPEDDRKDFYLYVDEFQNFVTNAFAGILSEARKYRLNLTIAHQYTAQLITENGSMVRDAVFGNVGTMIVFRVGADDADFLEKEFEPEFTPQDIVNLPNYKIYLRLMINGVTSRPFSAKTLPPMAKNPDINVEKEVIKMSRSLYCKSKTVVEKEINDWSGMSLGNEEVGDVEKFAATCSICKSETKVPFKPEPGRPVYCKDCISKLKSGELKPIKGSMNQIRHDETTFFKPLSDLGIEFENKGPSAQGNTQEKNARYPDRNQTNNKKPNVFSKLKKVFVPNQTFNQDNSNTKDRPIPGGVPKKFFNNQNTNNQIRPKKVIGENLALREILNKTLNENKVLPARPHEGAGGEAKKEEPVPISLNDLRTPKPLNASPLQDRSASSHDMNRLKDLITEKTEDVESTPSVSQENKQEVLKDDNTTTFIPKIPEEKIIEKKEEIKKAEETETQIDPVPQTQVKIQPSVSPSGKIREVPEDILRKILE